MSREQLAKDNGMTIEFVNWFFEHKKDGCGNAWFMMMAAMWEGYQAATASMQSERDQLAAQLADVVAESAALKSNLIYWDDEDSYPVRSPLDYAHGAGLEDGEEFEMQVAARMPNLTYRVVSTSRFRTEIELVSGSLPQTPATDRFLAEQRAQESSPLVRALTVIANSEQHDGDTVVCDFDTLISVASGALRDYYAAQLRNEVKG